MLFDLENYSIKNLITQAEFGIERESLRVNLNGTLAQTKHPFGSHPNIDRDFCENQIEIIGDVFTNPELLNNQLIHLQNKIDTELRKNNEMLWPFSNPPKITGEDEIPVADFCGTQKNKSLYRYYLAEKYGKKKMLFSGIHLNFSFSEALLNEAFSLSGETNFHDYKNNLYLSLAKRLTEYAWLVVYLTAASPVADASIGVPSNSYSSIRCSKYGYWNTFTPILDYTNLNGYIFSVAKYISNGALRAASELYYPVRIKPRGANTLEALLQNGVNHLELRVLDVNPLSRTGIFTQDIRFIHLLMVYLASLPDFEFNSDEQINAINNIKSAAIFQNTQIKQKAKTTLNNISLFVNSYFPEYRDILDYQLNKLHTGNSYAEIISRKYSANYMSDGILLAKSYQRGQENV